MGVNTGTYTPEDIRNARTREETIFGYTKIEIEIAGKIVRTGYEGFDSIETRRGKVAAALGLEPSEIDTIFDNEPYEIDISREV